jgi:cytidine deaminase
MISKDLKDQLISLAKEAQKKSYTPYSKFPVGAAIMTESGDLFTGCNVENISYGLSNCAERTAIFKMISEKGSKEKIKAIAVTSQADIPCTPCGACRQVIQEFSTSNTVVISKGQDGYVVQSIEEQLPGAFSEFVTLDQDGSTTRIQVGL